jgi:hypothetical protein
MGMGIDGIRKRLIGQPDFAGIESAAICQKDDFSMDAGTGEVSHKIKGITVEQRGAVLGAWCRIKRTGKTPLLRMVSYTERAVYGNPSWDRMPLTMVQKTAEMDCIRAAYPDKFGGVYSDEELAAGYDEMASPAQTLPAPAATTEGEVIAAPAAPRLEATSDATITNDQGLVIRSWMQEFQLSGEELGDLIEVEAGPKPASMAKLTKPAFQKMFLLFKQLRNGEVTLDKATMKIIRPPA